MTQPDFGELLRDAGLSQRELARVIRVHPNTVSRWALEQAPVPGSVHAYLGLRVWVRRMLDQVVTGPPYH